MTLKDIVESGVTITSSLLESEIKKYAQSYYEGSNEISDDEFDELVDLLRKMDPDSEVLNMIGWGFDISSVPGDKVEHKYQLVGSLNKARDVSQISNSILSKEYVLSAKLDGLSGVAYYSEGKLVRAVTRGNGKIGIDVTDKFRMISKSDLGGSTFSGAIRGEFVISNRNWEVIQESNSDAKSRRNYAAGIINRNEVTDDLSYLSFVPYNIVGAEEEYQIVSDMYGIFSWLSERFEECVPHSVYMRNIPDVSTLENYYNMFKEEFPIDGLVITAMEPSYDKETKAVVYDQMAYKFQSERKYAKVNGIRWNLTRTNKLVPVVQIEPTELAEATINNVTGFNARYIKDNEIGIGAIIEIERSGEVIPDIQSVITPKESNVKNLPDECPICGHKLEWQGVDLVCNNQDCGNRDYRDLQCWVNNLGKIDNLGDTLKFKFMDELGYTCIDDLYTKELIISWARGTQKTLFVKMMNKLINDPVDAIDALCALNIPRLGRTSAKKLANEFDLLNCLMDYAILGTETDSVELEHDIAKILGPATASKIMENLNKLDKLKYVRSRMVYETIVTTEMQKVAITGKLSMKRADFEKILNDNGYEVTGVSKDTKFLITDNPNSNSSKNKLADKFGVEKITEEEFTKKYIN